MIRFKMVQSAKTRTENWSEAEKKILTDLIKERYDEIENRCTDSSSNSKKSKAWVEIWQRFVAKSERPRTLANLRTQWKNLKCKQKRTSQKRDVKLDNDIEPDIEQSKRDLLEVNLDNMEEFSKRNLKNSYNSDFQPARKFIEENYSSPKSGIDYKKSLLQLNKLVKEQITNCALAEHELRMQQLQEEHKLKLKIMNEMHSLECENKRLEAQLLQLNIELKRKQLNNFVM